MRLKPEWDVGMLILSVLSEDKLLISVRVNENHIFFNVVLFLSGSRVNIQFMPILALNASCYYWIKYVTCVSFHYAYGILLLFLSVLLEREYSLFSDMLDFFLDCLPIDVAGGNSPVSESDAVAETNRSFIMYG